MNGEERPIDREALAAVIDHTLLDPDARRDAVVQVCEEARTHDFGAVCVNPYRISTARDELEETDVRLCSVVSFPFGAATPTMKMRVAYEAVSLGADELDVVANVGALKDGEYDYVHDEIAALRQSLDDTVIKVILETGYLTEDEIRQGATNACEAGANFVKTSTGYGPGGATVEDVKLLREAVGDDYGVKAAGGVRSYEQALELIEAGASRLGTSRGVAVVEGAPEENGG